MHRQAPKDMLKAYRPKACAPKSTSPRQQETEDIHSIFPYLPNLSRGAGSCFAGPYCLAGPSAKSRIRRTKETKTTQARSEIGRTRCQLPIGLRPRRHKLPADDAETSRGTAIGLPGCIAHPPCCHTHRNSPRGTY